MLSSASTAVLRSGSSLMARTALRSSSTIASRLLAATTPRATTAAVVPSSQRFFSDSHDDFAPKKKKAVDGEEDAMKLIKEHVESNRIMLYMKGNPSMPMCGFSARVVEVLQKEGVDFSSVNVLDYPAIREGVKKYADWPTIPQLYVDGEFIGGCDIITSMHESGELKDVLKEQE